LIFKDEKLRAEWWDLTPKLRMILADIDFYCWKKDLKMVCTSFVRTAEEQENLHRTGHAASKTSVHMYGRGADIRLLFPVEENQKLIDYINMKYPYDPKRATMYTVLRHEGLGDHLHVQSVE
jgi:hypothetical protein